MPQLLPNWVGEFNSDYATEADRDYYISTTGSDTTGNGSATAPYATLEKVRDVLPLCIKHVINIYILAGTYYEHPNFYGKYLTGSGEINIIGATSRLTTLQTATGGDDENADGLGEIVVAGAGWNVNDYAGKMVLFVTTTGISDIIYYKYARIISNTADTLLTHRLYFTPGVNTTFYIVQNDTTLSGATSGTPNTPVAYALELHNIQASSAAFYNGLYYKQNFTLEALIFKNGYGGSVNIDTSTVFMEGIEFQSTSTNSIRGVDISENSYVTLYGGIMCNGEVHELTSSTLNSVTTVYGVYGDFTTQNIGIHSYCVYATAGNKTYLGDFAFIGDAANPINSMAYGSGPGSYVNISKGRVVRANNIMRTGGTAFVGCVYTDGIFGANNQSLYTATYNGYSFAIPQLNAGYTTQFDIDDTSKISYDNDSSGVYSNVEHPRSSLTVAADTTITTKYRYLSLTAAGAVVLTDTPTIEAGSFIGQRLTLLGTSDVNTVTLQDNGTLAGSNLFLIDTTNRVLGSRDIITFVWDGSSWYEADDIFPLIKNMGSYYSNTTTVNAGTYDLDSMDYILKVDYTATGAVTSLTLPTAQCITGRTIIIKDTGGNAGTNNITIDTEGAELIDGQATYIMSTNYESITLVSDGSNWFIL